MRLIFLLLFGYLVYRFLIKPVLLGPAQQQKRYRNPQDDMLEMMRRMQQYQQQQQQQYQQQQRRTTEHSPRKSRTKDDGEYIDFEEVD
jgi:esterase/lipase